MLMKKYTLSQIFNDIFTKKYCRPVTVRKNGIPTESLAGLASLLKISGLSLMTRTKPGPMQTSAIAWNL